MPPRRSRPHKVLDLFSGVGGFSLGFENAGGFETGAFCEIDEAAVKVLAKHWPSVPVHRDVCALTGEGDYSVIAGGFPCQDISIAGRQVGIHGKRSGLWAHYARLIAAVRPAFAVIENVSNLRAKGLARVLRNLAESGYDAEFHLIPASAIGAWHRRERIWIIAYPCGAAGKGQLVTKERVDSFAQSSSVWRNFAANGLPPTTLDAWSRNPVREARIKQMGNAIVPQIAEMIAGCIKAGFESASVPPLGASTSVLDWEDLRPLTGRSGTLRGGMFTEITPTCPFDEDRDCGMFPTPTCRDALVKGARLPERMIRPDGRNVLRQPGLAEMMFQARGFPIVKQELLGLPIPVEELRRFAKFSERKSAIVGNHPPGVLNPAWVEALMGFPPSWTDVS